MLDRKYRKDVLRDLLRPMGMLLPRFLATVYQLPRTNRDGADDHATGCARVLPPPKWLRNRAGIRQPVQNKQAD